MFSRTTAASFRVCARSRGSTPASRLPPSARPSTSSLSHSAPVRFQSSVKPPGAGRGAGPDPVQLKESAQRARSARIWLSAALIAGSAVTGYLFAQGLRPTLPPLAFLLPSDVAIPLQETHQPSYGSKADYLAAIEEIKEYYKGKGREDDVSTDEEDLTHHGVSEWSYHGAELPTVVVWVESTPEVQEIVRIARKHRVPITPFSGGTSLEGHFSSVCQLWQREWKRC